MELAEDKFHQWKVDEKNKIVKINFVIKEDLPWRSESLDKSFQCIKRRIIDGYNLLWSGSYYYIIILRKLNIYIVSNIFSI